MAVTNRGSILISTANDIGSSLVDVIGGEGYTPNEWSKKINLCGIAAADVPTALENIEESTPSGTDRGSISLDTANAVGAVLNKKFNTARGFKPSEWASAISKLTELEVKTASGSVASFDDGADDVPLKSCTCEIVPQQDLHGYANPWAPGAGKNKLNNEGYFPNNGEVSNYYYKEFAFNLGNIPNITLIADTTYTLSFDVESSVEPFNVSVGCGGGAYSSDILTVYNKSNGRVSITFTPTAAQLTNGAILAFRVPRFGASQAFTYSISNVQLEIGSTATAYEPYSNICPITGTTDIEVTHTDGQNPPIESETKTAALGRTVYGGSHDFISGELSETIQCKTLREVSDNITYAAASGYNYFNIPKSAVGAGSVLFIMSCYPVGSSGTDNTCWKTGTSLRFRDDSFTNVSDLLQALGDQQICYDLSSPNAYNLEGQEISSYLGDNNIFSDVQGGNTTVEYRADIDLAAT